MGKKNERCISSNVGSYIRYLREQKGYSLKEMEKKCKVSASYIMRIETGERTAPNIIMITFNKI